MLERYAKSNFVPSVDDFELRITEINLGVSSAIKAAENPPMFSLQMLQSALDDGVRKCKGFILNKNTLPHGSNSSSHFNTESNQR
ncbi:hypothetical protein P8452_59741 [Trifolium repens]|nr:hypothetical protein P8452_59741 [Trifolium repens]